jgi:membrane fusion protein (multidrug efflux system)
VSADGKAEQRPVTVSQTVGDQWLVESGLAAGDKVIVEGLQKIRPGALVQASEMRTGAPAANARPETSAAVPD